MTTMPSNHVGDSIRHSTRPQTMACWFDGSNSLDAPAVAPVTAPHDCMMPGCPGPVNKRKLEAFDDLLAAAERVAAYLSIHVPDYWQSNADAETLRAAIARAGPQAR